MVIYLASYTVYIRFLSDRLTLVKVRKLVSPCWTIFRKTNTSCQNTKKVHQAAKK